MLTCGTLELFLTTWNTHFFENAYMWDPTKFYDDLGHSILKKCLYVGPKLVYDTADMAKMLTCETLANFMTNWNILFSEKCLHVGSY
jgi:hypothetical protein